MNRSALLTAALIFGIQFGWSEFRKGETEYIIQVDDEAIEALRSGESFFSAVPPQLQNVTRVRIQYGTEPPGQPRLSYFGNRETESGRREIAATNNNAESNSEQDPNAPINYRGRELTQDSRDPRRNGPLAERIESPVDYGRDPQNGQRGNPSLAHGEPPMLVPPQPSSMQNPNQRDDQWEGRSQQSQGGRDIASGVSPINMGNSFDGSPNPAGNQISPLDDPLASEPSIADITGATPGPMPAEDYGRSSISIPNVLPLPRTGLTDNIASQATGLLQLNGADGEINPYRERAYNSPPRTESSQGSYPDGQDQSQGRPPSRGVNSRPQREIAPPTDQNVANNQVRSPAQNETGDDARDSQEDTTPVAHTKPDDVDSGKEATDPPPDSPWLWTFFLLCLSLGGNVYLTWIARGSYLRYRELSDQQRRASLDRIMLE